MGLKETILEAIEEHEGDLKNSFFYGDEPYLKGDTHWETGEPFDNTPEGLKDVEWELLNQTGGMDEGSTYFSVWKFTRGDESVILKFDGWYQSHYGAELEDIYEVHPQQKTVTYYE